MSKIDRFFNELQNKQVCFIGAGVSHLPCIEQFVAKGIQVCVRDASGIEKFGQELYSRLDQMGVKLVLGPDYLKDMDEDVIFRTPGMMFTHPALQQARSRGQVVTSEMECFFDLCPCKIVAVTGSDGKTTSTTVIAKILEHAGYTVHLGGNIGRALLPVVEQIKEEDVAVVELSSFQLMSMRQSPHVALITNVAPNHLDKHTDMQEYVDAKCNLLLHQGAFDKAVLNANNDITRCMQRDVRGDLYWFNYAAPVQRGAYLRKDGMLCMAVDNKEIPLLHKSEIKLPGEHNVDNYLGVISTVWGMVSPEDICHVARNFGGVEHRIEYVRTVSGVKFYNDSIATSPTRSIAGLRAFGRRIVLIAGGYDKKIPYEPIGPVVAQYVKVLVLMGATAPKIEQAVREAENFDPQKTVILHADTMEQAVQLAYQSAHEGDIVSLSPASASFDLYKNFEERGCHFKRVVAQLEEK